MMKIELENVLPREIEKRSFELSKEKRDDKSNCLYGQGGSHEQTADFCNRQCTDCPDPAL